MPETTLTHEDVQLIIAESRRLDGMRDDIQRFFGMMMSEQILASLPGYLLTDALVVPMHPSSVSALKANYTLDFSHGVVTSFTIQYGAQSYNVLSGKHQSMPSVMVEPVWQSLPELLQALANRTNAVGTLLMHLRRGVPGDPQCSNCGKLMIRYGQRMFKCLNCGSTEPR